MSVKDDDEPEVKIGSGDEEEEIIEAVAEDDGNEIAVADDVEPGAAPGETHPGRSAQATIQESSESVGDRDSSPEYSGNIKRILDIELPVTVSFGSASRSLEEVLKMSPGSLIELETTAEEPVVLKVNDKAFAWGKVVDVDGYYGVEITEIVGQADRLATLGGH